MALPKKGTILIVDDEEGIRRSLEKILKYEGFEIILAENGQQGVNLALQEDPDLIFCDVKMPRMDGLEVLDTLKSQGTRAPVVMISGHASVQNAVEATRRGAFDFLEKPLDRERILIVTRNALEKVELVEENKALQKQVTKRFTMVGEHDQFKKLVEKIDKVAPTTATVLITGESGTGKELIARRIHNESGRKGNFVEVNCAAIPEELIESELFGHAKGAFTGAVDQQIGKFQLADGGTLFLDEVGDMSLTTQAKVLRVLQEGEFSPVGSNKTVHVDVRVVAATNKDLEEAITENAFREDLYFRLNVVPLQSIPLHERRSDIPDLIEHFRKAYTAELGYPDLAFGKETMAFLQSRSYRGNIRELKNLVERMLILGESEVIETLKSNSGLRSRNQGFDFESFSTLKTFKDEMERRFLVAKLKQNNGNISKTAEAIDTPRSNLYKKLEQYQINVDQLLS